MEKLKEIVLSLASASGPSGGENDATRLASKYLSEYGEVEIDPIGNLICRISPPKEGGMHILLDAHLDEIGLIVTGINKNGFIHVTDASGMDPRTLSSHELVIHSKEGELFCLVTSTPPHITDPKDYKKAVSLNDIYLDAGFDTKEEAEEKISIGDRVTLRAKPLSICGTRVMCKSLDDRAGCASILHALEQIKGTDLSKIGLSVSFSTMEEFSAAAAAVAAFSLSPTHAIVVDGTPSDQEFLKPHESTSSVGGGVAVKVGVPLDREMSAELKKIAEDKKINHIYKASMGRSTGTNADKIVITKSGIRTALLSIPQRYAHTACEIMDLKDIKASGDIMAAYIKEKARA